VLITVNRENIKVEINQFILLGKGYLSKLQAIWLFICSSISHFLSVFTKKNIKYFFLYLINRKKSTSKRRKALVQHDFIHCIESNKTQPFPSKRRQGSARNASRLVGLY
jgi:hypothetical protein